MKLNNIVFISTSAGFVGLAFLITSTSVLAQNNQESSQQVVKNDTVNGLVGKKKTGIVKQLKTKTPIENIPQLKYFQIPNTKAKNLLVQSEDIPESNLEDSQEENSANTQITGVKLKQTSDGLQVILETSSGTLKIGDTFNEGNTFILEIDNAVLTLPSGQEFRTITPADGIDSITVTQIESSNKVKVTVTGSKGLPTASVLNTANGLNNGLTLNLSPIEAQADIELTVTAQKRPENVQDIPLSVTVIPQQEIEDAQIDSFIDIANQTPNFNFFPTSAGGTEFSYYTMRGLNNQNFLTAQDSVAFYIDDVPVDYNGFLDLAFTDLERVEVLRGPQSTLYGRNSSAGAVNVISREATPEPEIKFGFGYGKYNSKEFQFSLNDALVSDKLALRIAGSYKGQDGFIENLTTGNTIGERERITARAQLVWKPTSDWKVSFNSYNSFTDDGNPTYNRRDAPDPFEVNLQTEGFNKLDTNTQALKIGYNGKNFQATSITARRFTRQENVVPGDTGVQIIDDINSTVWTQEIRLQSPETADRFKWLLGGYYEFRDFVVDDSQSEFVGFGRFRRFGDDNRETYAVFGQVDYKPIEPLTLFAGLRYESSDASSDSSYESVDDDGNLTPLRPEFEDEKVSNDEWIPRFGLKYELNPNLIAYTTIAKGYRPGGLNYRANSEAELRFGEEKTWSYEVGLKSSWLDNRLIANLAFFHNDVSNYQVLQFDESGFFGSVNNVDLKATGVELELKAQPVEGLDLTASVGYVDSEYKNYLNSDTGVDLSDNQVPLAPQFTYNLAAQYRSLGGLFARAELRGYGITYFDDANEIEQDPYIVVNTRIGYEAEKYGIYLYANNLFDTRYITSGFLFPPPIQTVGFGDPVTYGVQFRAKL